MLYILNLHDISRTKKKQELKEKCKEMDYHNIWDSTQQDGSQKRNMVDPTVLDLNLALKMSRMFPNLHVLCIKSYICTFICTKGYLIKNLKEQR